MSIVKCAFHNAFCGFNVSGFDCNNNEIFYAPKRVCTLENQFLNECRSFHHVVDNMVRELIDKVTHIEQYAVGEIVLIIFVLYVRHERIEAPFPNAHGLNHIMFD